jgi:repressor LexA
MKEPTQRQKEVLSFISDFVREHSYPPTIREVADHFEISVKGAYDHVMALKKKGKLRLSDKRSRTMEVVRPEGEREMDGCTLVPVLGVVPAGRPVLAEENFDGAVPIHNSFLKKNRQYFGLKVKGESMQGAGIFDKDLAVVQKQNTAKDGDNVVAVVDDAVTLKRFFKESNRVKLQPENPDFQPIYSQDVKVLGKLAYVIRAC